MATERLALRKIIKNQLLSSYMEVKLKLCSNVHSISLYKNIAFIVVAYALYHTPKERQLTDVPELQNISLISHPSKVMLKIILNRLQSQAEEIIAEQQTGFRAGRSTTEQIFNLRILGEKYLQHQQNHRLQDGL